MTKNDNMIVTPTGTASWPKLDQPDTKYQKDGSTDPKDKEYTVDLILDPSNPDVDLFLSQLDERVEEAYAEAIVDMDEDEIEEFRRAKPYKFEKNRETKEKTGNVVMSFKKPAFWVEDGGEAKPLPVRLFDAAGGIFKTPEGSQLSSGSQIQVAFICEPYNFGGKAGVTRKLAAVRVLEAHYYTGGGGAAEDFGFDSAPATAGAGNADEDNPF